MYSGYGGSPSRALSTMSLSVRPVRSLSARSITRSQSFTGVNIYDKPYRNLSVFSTPGVSRKPSRASRMFTISNKSNPPPKVPQPERLDQVYEALKKGLLSYLQVYQMELDSLSKQMKESKRNSRLGFLYELDKQVKVTERYIRRLEFHLSKIEELYEAYCLQRRLRDGANKMVKAYTMSTGSKEARESLTEANKGYKEYTENMCVLENEIENQLGEFHIKMKGLAGFARLCAGDQYEILMRYGRQRWKLRGRIEINGKQVWDSEETVFLPLISDFLAVKLTELKSLANHVVVGSVSCETKDLFAALPQTVAVDINDLGTIKLSLEVSWNPFDKDEPGSVASTVNKAPSVSKRFSTIFNQSPPDTPSLREQAFYSLPRSLTRRQHWPLLDTFRDTLSQSCSCSDSSPARQTTANMLRHHEELESGRAWSNSSESSDDSSSPQLSHDKAVVVTPDIQPVVTGSPSPQTDVSFCLRDSSSPAPNSPHRLTTVTHVPSAESIRGEEKATVTVSTQVDSKEATTAGRRSPVGAADEAVASSRSYSRSLSHISESSVDGVSGEVLSLTSGLSVNDIEMEVQGRSPEPHNSSATHAHDTSSTSLMEENTMSADNAQGQQGHVTKQEGADPVPAGHTEPSTKQEMSATVPENSGGGGGVSVEEDVPAAGPTDSGPVDSGLEDALGAVVSSLDDYRGQFPELQLLEEEIKLLQVTLKGGRHSRSPSVVSLTVQTALGSFDFLNMSDWEDQDEEQADRGSRDARSLADSPPSPLTTGCSDLDCCLVVHLKNCCTQLLHLGMFGPLRCGEMYALDRLLREAQVLGMIRCIGQDNPPQPGEVIPQLNQCLGAMSLWQQCVVGQGSVYSAPAGHFHGTLSEAYSGALPERATNIADAVFWCLVERVCEQRLPRRGSSRGRVPVTVFQLWSYLDANSIADMDTHITELAEEVWLVQSLASCDPEVLLGALRRPTGLSLRREGLHAVAKLLKDPRGKVSASASSVLRGLAIQPAHREQALVSCLELLEDDSVDTRVCGCKALACLKAKESIDQLVYLCQTDKEEVRDAAKQTLLVLGEEGKIAHRHVETSQDSLPRLFTPGSMASTAF